MSIQDLLNNATLYSANFIENSRKSETHWFIDNDHQREASLCHDYCCYVLANGIKAKDPRPFILPPNPNKRKRRDSDSDSDEYNTDDDDDGGARLFARKKKGEAIFAVPVEGSDSSGSDDDDPESDYNTDDDDNVPTLDDKIRDDSQIDKQDTRFIVLEGNIAKDREAAIACAEWGIELPGDRFDIIDRDEKKFIEVKISSHVESKLNLHRLRVGTNPVHFSLLVIDPQTGKCHWFDHPGNVPTEPKIEEFILNRKVCFESLGLIFDDLTSETDLVRRVFSSYDLNKMVDEWVARFWGLRHLEQPKNLNDDTYVMTQIRPENFLEHLEDPRERQCEVVQWQGKLIPDPICGGFLTRDREDHEMNRAVMERILDANFVSGNTVLFKAVKELAVQYCNESFERRKDNFRCYTPEEVKYNQNKELFDMLGIGAKKTRRNDEALNCNQPSVEPIEKRKYHPWFDSLIKDMSYDHELGNKFFVFRDLREEPHLVEHPVSKDTNHAVTQIIKKFSVTNAAFYSSRVINAYSRLGGAYASPNADKRKFSNVVMFPIYATATKQGVESFYRHVSGVIIRGPHHARISSDKINIITIEEIKDCKRSIAYSKFIKKATFIKCGNVLYCVRQNAISKQDPAFLAYVNNALFVAANSMGEVALKTGRVMKFNNLRSNFNDYLENHGHWLMERIVESVLMATLGNSQEEGAMAGTRKVFMCMLLWARGETKTFNADIKGFCDKINECIISSPLAMHYQCSLIEILKTLNVTFLSTSSWD